VDFSNFQALGVTHPGTLDTDSLEAAIDAFTRQAAWASFDEQRKGTLARDMLADVVVLTKDIFAVPPSRLSDADVSVTIFDGKVVFQKNAETEY
jgi:predicted amidohydrolase YtcJ